MNGTYENIDCMGLMANLKDKEIDLAIVDPPYGIGLPIVSAGKWKRRIHEKKAWDTTTPDEIYFKELFRVSKNQIIWGGNYFISKIKNDSPCWIFWDKKNGTNFMSDGEIAYTSFNTAVRRFEYNHIQEYNIGIDRIHPTQKPVKLYEWLLTNYAKPNDLILDTHCGSASSLIACENLGFKYIASELDKDYYQESMKRLETHLSYGKLFQRVGNEVKPETNLFEEFT